NIAEFWRRWHITLSRFLRDYIYIPLGGNRRGNARKYTNLFVTMLIGGIWHGAGWTFVVWGALHGTYLLIYHVWRDRKADSTHHAPRTTHQQSTAASARMSTRRFFAHASTFLAIVIAWVLFRADSFQAATNILISMTGFHGLTSDLARLHQSNGWVLVIPLLLAVWFLPNSNQLLARFAPTLEYVGADASAGPKPLPTPGKLAWAPNFAWGFVIAALTVISMLCFSRASE